MIEKRGNQWCVVHGHPEKKSSKIDKPKGTVIKCFDNREDAEKMHNAIILKQKGINMNEWDEIFRVPLESEGVIRDSGGKEYSAADCEAIIEKAVASYDPEYHKAPIRIGHSGASPAYGWIVGLKSDLNKDGVKALFAKYEDVQPEFIDWHNKKLYQKKSAGFNPDGSFNHLAYLGGTPPAVKGLPDHVFKEGEECQIFEFAEKGGIMDKITGEIPAVASTDIDTVTATLHTADIITDDKEKHQAVMEFAEQSKKIAELERKIKRQEIDHYVEKLPPAWADAGIGDFMESLDNGTAIEFSEKKETQTEWFRNFVEKQLKELKLLFNKIATKDKTSDFSETEIEEETKIAKRIAEMAMGRR